MSTVTATSRPRRRRQWFARRVATGLLVALAVAACGPVMGALWAWLSPRGLAVVGPGGVLVADTQSQAAIAADGYFAVLGLTVGLACGVVAFLATRGRGVVAAVALAAGGCAGSVLAWWTGAWLGPEEVRIAARGADVGARLEVPLEIGAPGVLLAWPIAAVSVLLVLTAMFDRVEPDGAWRTPGPYRHRPSHDPAQGR
jgi:hypothetical protein